MEPRFITPFDSVIIINLIGMLSLLKLTNFLPIEWAELLLKKHIGCTSLIMEEGVGFEPTDGSAPSTDFKSAAFDHSANSPYKSQFFVRTGKLVTRRVGCPPHWIHYKQS